MRPAYAPTGAGRGDAVSGIKRADSASVCGSDAAPCACDLQRQWWSGWGRVTARLVAEHSPVVSARLTVGYPMCGCRRLTHRRASLALEAPIARPWISHPGLVGALGELAVLRSSHGHSEDHVFFGPSHRISRREHGRIEDAGQNTAALAQSLNPIGDESVVVVVAERRSR